MTLSSPVPNCIDLQLIASATPLPAAGSIRLFADLATGKFKGIKSDGSDAFPGGGGTPGGADTNVQFNDGGAFGGDSRLTFDKSDASFRLTGSTGIVSLSQGASNGNELNLGAGGGVALNANEAGAALNINASGNIQVTSQQDIALTAAGANVLEMFAGSVFAATTGATGTPDGDFTFAGAGSGSIPAVVNIITNDVAAFSLALQNKSAPATSGFLFQTDDAGISSLLFDSDSNNGIFNETLSGNMQLFSTLGKVELVGTKINLVLAAIPVFANNAAAIGGGLVAGDLYRTGANPDVLCIVH